MKRLLVCVVALLCLFPTSAHAQDTEDETPALPVIPYYTSQQAGRQFNVPIPAGWEVDDSDGRYLRMTNAATNGAIYVMKLTDAPDISAAVNMLITTVAPDFIGRVPHTQADITFDGLTWEIRLYDAPQAQDGNLTVYAQERDNAVYTVAYLNTEDAIDFYMLALQSESLNSPVTLDDILNRIYEGFDSTPQESQTISYGATTWQRNIFVVDGEQIITLHQDRAGSIYAVIQRGEGGAIDTVNRAMYTIIFGFFVTPQNTGFLWLGLAATMGIILLLLFSIYLRYRNAQKDLELIEQLEAE